MTKVQTFQRNEYQVYKTFTPYEIPDIESGNCVPSVVSNTYEIASIDENESWYIAKNKPISTISEITFFRGEAGECIEDDYTRVEITEAQIIYTEK